MKKDVTKNFDDDVKDLDKQKKNFLWVQEFSKKIIVAILIVYILYSCLLILKWYVKHE